MPVTTIPPPSVSMSSSASTPPASKPVFFWQPRDGNGYLCQWYWSKFTLDAETYVTTEMWMMVQKARCFNDEEIAKQMLETTDPKTHKQLGRMVSGFDEKVWDERKLEIVTQGNYHKFTISEDAENLRGMLLATGERELVEASPHDRIWGVGFAEKDAERNRYRWGKNLLGRALMDVRKKLREEDWK
ncbi:hypothetical protein J4E90_000241 [Alternaria incomplexa]|uniref:uncharacterized protein n=1 Tax=Alternaria incomplexa TaxID=1187928 RepID=UPI002220267A|nr:uncharacterized protein J4E90_000241 [Alternaria incomplexa]KAI4921814.1 hypothetical protein J4E90_000241 [Alternaria incomplexa]